jgi:hypothetical protein
MHSGKPESTSDTLGLKSKKEPCGDSILDGRGGDFSMTLITPSIPSDGVLTFVFDITPYVSGAHGAAYYS